MWVNNYFKYRYNWDYLWLIQNIVKQEFYVASGPIIPHRILLEEDRPLPVTAWKDVRE